MNENINLVMVESPTKSKMLQKFLGSKYLVEASMGHIRDLPKSELGIDIEQNFEPKYVIPRDKAKKVNELKKIAKEAKNLWLATDPDREGEAIAWHLKYLLTGEKGAGDIPAKRVVFHEITESAIKEAFANPRDLDMRLIDAQQARRVLDRLVGYKLSPLLWQKVKSGLSAGRVQSVALRLIVEREAEINAFKPVEYWSIEAELESVEAGVAFQKDSEKLRNPDKSENQISGISDNLKFRSSGVPSHSESFRFTATLIELNGKKLAIKNKAEADTHLKVLEKAEYKVKSVNRKEVKKYPSPPFTTSTLQQTAANRLGMSAKKTMMIAQALYEHGLITYMRTDSVNLSSGAISQARSYIEKNIGKVYLPASAKVYKTKSKVAQEAHEAIRPTDINLTLEKLKTNEGISRDHLRIYDLIWKRMLASQMNEAVIDQTTIDVSAVARGPVASVSQVRPRADKSTLAVDARDLSSASPLATSPGYLFRSTGSIVKFDGWLKIYGKTAGEEDESDDEKSKSLPEVTENDPLDLIKLLPEQHFTEPQPRFNDASLIKKLEELGIGRPSTYAPILSTIQDRFYVEKRERKFFPTELGIAVIKFLMKYFSDIFDYAFTAEMEDNLDAIANGEKKWQPTIETFYSPFSKKLESVEENAEKVKIEVEITDKDCPKCGKKLVIKFGKFGKFLACSGFPDCKHTESFEQNINIKCPNCGGDLVIRKTRKGRPFYGCKNWPNCKFASWTKPKISPEHNKTPGVQT